MCLLGLNACDALAESLLLLVDDILLLEDGT
jgi:hypothetical protein